LPKYEPLPAPVSNNAVASVKTRGSFLLFSMMGIGAKKTWDVASNAAYSLDESPRRQQGRGNISFFSAGMSWTRRVAKPLSPTSMCTNRSAIAGSGRKTYPCR
jgi:hypothetical protein